MTNSKLINVDDNNFSAEVESANMPVLVDFGATWCAPCKTLGATLGNMVDEYKGKVKFCYVDVVKAPRTVGRFAVSSVPTIVLFKNGVPAGALVGAQPKAKLDELISRALGSR